MRAYAAKTPMMSLPLHSTGKHIIRSAKFKKQGNRVKSEVTKSPWTFLSPASTVFHLFIACFYNWIEKSSNVLSRCLFSCVECLAQSKLLNTGLINICLHVRQWLGYKDMGDTKQSLILRILPSGGTGNKMRQD